jgi:hypothetical protein
MKLIILSTSVLAAVATSLHAGSRGSAAYHIPTDSVDAGGRRTTSASYTNDGSVGGVVGISSVATPAETAKHGYIGQLYDVTGLLLSATPTTVNEGGTLQLSAGQLLDDATTLAVPANSITWSVAAGPLTGIDASGLATAGLVYQATAATAQGVSGIYSGTLALTVLNVNLDNFGAYAGDTLDDAWQVQYFGLPPNALAGPLADPDRDGQDNAFEFTAGLVPTDPNSVFQLRIEKVAPPSNAKKLIFSPRFGDRTYAVWFRPNLATPPLWDRLTGTTQSDLGSERTVTDPNGSGQRFYRVEITKP